MTQVAQIEAHDSEVLCLEFTSPEAGDIIIVVNENDAGNDVFCSINLIKIIHEIIILLQWLIMY